MKFKLKFTIYLEVLRIALRYIYLFLTNINQLTKISELKKYKRNDALLIIGAGASLNKFLTLYNASKKLKCDVCTLSWSAIANINSTYFLYEKPTDPNILHEHGTKLLKLFEKKIRKKQISAPIWKNIQNKTPMINFNEELYKKLPVINVKFYNSKMLKFIVDFYINSFLKKFFLIQSRGSLFTSCLLAKVLGYKKVYLIGFDLNGSQYFIMNNPSYKQYRFLDPYTTDKWVPSSGYHFTSDPRHKFKIQDALKAIRTSSSFEIINLSENSLLKHQFKTITLSKFFEIKSFI